MTSCLLHLITVRCRPSVGHSWTGFTCSTEQYSVADDSKEMARLNTFVVTAPLASCGASRLWRCWWRGRASDSNSIAIVSVCSATAATYESQSCATVFGATNTLVFQGPSLCTAVFPSTHLWSMLTSTKR
jgi:hypothetical protein